MHKTFEKSRVLEYFSEKELSMQMGAHPDSWALMLVKELIDNAIDACESADIPPTLNIHVTNDSFSVADNGNGIPFDTVQKSLNYNTRVSSNDAYIRPTRGQLGNAMKLVWAAPYVATDSGSVTVIGGGYRHQVSVTTDPLSGEPKIEHDFEEAETTGTIVKIDWIGLVAASCESNQEFSEFTLRSLCEKYSLLNPHLTMSVSGLWEFEFIARDKEWKVWSASRPGSIWWYSFSQFQDLITRYLIDDRSTSNDTTLREFLTVFDGFTGSRKQKQVTDVCELKNALLKDLLDGDELNESIVYRIFQAMRELSKAVTPQRFGAIGKVFGEEAQYRCKKTSIIESGRKLPCVVEASLESVESNEKSFYVYGLNNAVVFDIPSSYVSSLLAENHLTDIRVEGMAIRFFLHIRCPEFEFLDRGKQRLELPTAMKEAITEAVNGSTKKWKKYVGNLKRNQTITKNKIKEFIRSHRPKKTTIKGVAYEVMEQAYLKASDGGRLPANARQIMYAARPYILERITADKFDDAYFTQTLLPDFMAESPALTSDWQVAYDPRGNFIEPRGGRIPLGTLDVDSYLRSWSKPSIKVNNGLASVSLDSQGFAGKYHGVLFLEKEGFHALLKSVQIAERYDIAIMSTKGMTSTASRTLLEELSKNQIPVFILHDFDKAGISIAHTFQNDTRRYQFDVKPIVHDFGIRLEDVERLELQSEPVSYGTQKKDPRINLIESGATEDEARFLVTDSERVYSGGKYKSTWHGQRVELNALTSRQLLDLIEEKLQAHGVGKLIPDDELITELYRQNVKTQKLNEVLQQAAMNFTDEDFYIPEPNELRIGVEKVLEEHPSLSWADAVKRLTEYREAS